MNAELDDQKVVVMNSEELKPCPFCGGKAEFGSIENKKHPDAGGNFICCTNKLCYSSSALIFPLMDDVRELLICRWNRRVNDDAHQPDVDDITKTLEYYRACLEQREPKWVPSRVRLKTDVRADPPFGAKLIAYAGEHDCHANRYGAISVIASNGEWVGVRPKEFDPLEWLENESAK